MKTEADRNRACDLYEVQLALDYHDGKVTDEDLDELSGMALMCYCKPKRCHGDTLAKVVDMDREERRAWMQEVIDGFPGRNWSLSNFE